MGWYGQKDVDLAELVGLTIANVRASDDEIEFEFEDGRKALFYHEQDCCEGVWVEDVNGDWEDLVGTPLLVADERDSSNEPPLEQWEESYTWTFYTFRTIKGSVDVRWYGRSNGYYSERVDVVWRNVNA